MFKKYIVLIGLIVSCIGTMNAMEPTRKPLYPSYRQSLTFKPSYYTGYRPNFRERFQTWWQQPTHYELQLQAKEKQLYDNLERLEKRVNTALENYGIIYRLYLSGTPVSISLDSKKYQGRQALDAMRNRVTELYIQKDQAQRQLDSFRQPEMREEYPVFD